MPFDVPSSRHRRHTIDINIESWYPLIEDHTFPTEFLPFSPAVGALFVEAYESYPPQTRLQRGAPAQRELRRPGWDCSPVTELGGALQAVINRVEDRFFKAMVLFGSNLMSWFKVSSKMQLMSVVVSLMSLNTFEHG